MGRRIPQSEVSALWRIIFLFIIILIIVQEYKAKNYFAFIIGIIAFILVLNSRIIAPVIREFIKYHLAPFLAKLFKSDKYSSKDNISKLDIYCQVCNKLIFQRNYGNTPKYEVISLGKPETTVKPQSENKVFLLRKQNDSLLVCEDCSNKLMHEEWNIIDSCNVEDLQKKLF